jgi:anaerobic selenocysteine-containing dehydrogenase
MGLAHACLNDSDEELARQAYDWEHPSMRGLTLERLQRETSVRLSLPEPDAPFAEGNFPTASGKCELWSDALLAQGHAALPVYNAPRENPESNPELARRYPLAFLSPPAHHFLNSTFSAQPVFVRREGEPRLVLHPQDAAPRGIEDGQVVRVFNDRGSFESIARVSDAARPGVAVGLSIWWPKLSPGGKNSNAVTGQGLTDLGGGATFFDVLVEVERAGPKAAAPA